MPWGSVTLKHALAKLLGLGNLHSNTCGIPADGNQSCLLNWEVLVLRHPSVEKKKGNGTKQPAGINLVVSRSTLRYQRPPGELKLQASLNTGCLLCLQDVSGVAADKS